MKIEATCSCGAQFRVTAYFFDPDSATDTYGKWIDAHRNCRAKVEDQSLTDEEIDQILRDTHKAEGEDDFVTAYQLGKKDRAFSAEEIDATMRKCEETPDLTDEQVNEFFNAVTRDAGKRVFQ